MGYQSGVGFKVARDVTAPVAWVRAPTAWLSGTFTVSWGAQDEGAGPGGVYDIQYRVDDGPWTDWLTGTTATSAGFVGEAGHAYHFRVRTWDRVGNAREYPAAPDATTRIRAPVTKHYYANGQRVALRQGDVVYYIHTDHLGSTSLVTDQAAQLVARQRYHPYGGLRHASGILPTDYGFAGQRLEVGLGLYQMGARWYDPALGRWLSADALVPEPGNPQALNRYAYVYNNPLRYTDPSGHQGEEGSWLRALMRWEWRWQYGDLYLGVHKVDVELPELPAASWANSVVTPIESWANARVTTMEGSWQGLGIGVRWFFELGDAELEFDPRDRLTQDLRHDPALDQFREKWAAERYQIPWCWEGHSIDVKGDMATSLRQFAVEHGEAALGLLGFGSIEGRFDTVGIALGSLDKICAVEGGGGLVKIEATNTSDWPSFTRIPSTEKYLIPRRPRSALGPGGTMKERFWWWEPYSQHRR